MALDGVVVVDLTQVVAGPTCTKILRDLGARVIKVEATKRGHLPSGDTLRRMEPFLPGDGDEERAARSAYFAMLNAGKESCVLELNSQMPGAGADRALFEAMLARADVLVENFRAGVMARMGYDEQTLRRRFPGLVFASVSGFGQTGPYSDRKAVDTIVQAMSGFCATTGDEERPVKVGTTVSDLLAGVYAAAGVLAALRARHVSGDGSRVDVAMLDTSFAFMAREYAHFNATGREPPRRGNTSQIGYPFDVFKCADGKSFAVEAIRDEPFKIFCDVIGLPELPQDPRFQTWALRNENVDALRPLIRGKTSQLTRDQVLGPLLKIRGSKSFPVGPVSTMRDLAECPQLAHRRMYLKTADGRFTVIGNPIKIADVPEWTHAPEVPALNQHKKALAEEHSGVVPDGPAPRARAQAMPTAPLDGLLVVDMTHAVAGPTCSKVLADLGARVVKIENVALPGDMVRHFHPHVGVPEGGRAGVGASSNSSGYFAMLNSDKESVALNLDPRSKESAADRALLESLLSRADVLLENFRPGVLSALGFSVASLRRKYPRLVVTSVSGFGQTGPYAHRKAVDTIVQAMSGFVTTTGFKDQPFKVGTTVSDLLAGVYAAVGVLAGVNRRFVTGTGTHVDVSMLDTSFAFHPREVANFAVNGVEPNRTGNLAPSGYPFDVFECRDGKSFACAPMGRVPFEAFAKLLGIDHKVLGDLRFRSMRSRLEHSAALREIILEATMKRTCDDIVRESLAITGAAAFPIGPVRTMGDMKTCPQLAHRGMLKRSACGRFAVIGNPIKISGCVDTPVAPVPPLLDSGRARLVGEADPTAAGRTGWLDVASPGPRPVAWVSSEGEGGAVAEATPFFNGAGGGGRKKDKRHTYDTAVVVFSFPTASVTATNVLRSGVAVVNLATWQNRRDVYRAMQGPVRLSASEITPARAIRAPRITRSPVQIECRVYKAEALGLFTAFFCNVAHYRVSGSVVDADGRVEPRLLLPLAHLRGGHFAVGDDMHHMPFPASQGVKISGLGEQSHGADQRRQMEGQGPLPWQVPLSVPLPWGRPRSERLADLEYPGGSIPEPLPYNPFKALVVPRCIGWISTRSKAGVDNLSPYSLFTMIADDVVYFGPGGVHVEGGPKDARRDAEETGVFCVNTVTWDLRHEMNASSAYCGRGVDEFSVPNLQDIRPLRKLPCKKIAAPCVADSPLRLECEYLKTIDLPTCDTEVAGDAAILGRVISVSVLPGSPWHNGDWTQIDAPARGGYFNYHRIHRESVFRMQDADGGVLCSGPAVDRLQGSGARL